MKVLLINPFYEVNELTKTKIKTKTQILPPLGMLSIAAILEKRGHEVKFLDLPALGYPFEKIEKEVKDFNPELIGLFATTPTSKKAFDLASYLKQITNTPIILGGPHASCFPEEILKGQNSIDIVCIGEGEYTMLDLAENKPLHKIKGIYYRKNNKIFKNEKRPPIKNLDELPFPARHLINLKLYTPFPNQYRRLPVINMVTSRGCPYGKCTYCFEAGRLGHFYRRQSPQRIVDEIKYLVNTYNIKEIAFWDDNFVVGKEWMFEFCDLLKKENLDITWSCYARVNLVSPEILNKMAEGGCWNIFYGIESGNQELLDKIQKGINLQQCRDAIKWTHDAGIEARGAFMIGLPGETPEMAQKTINFAIELDVDYAQFAYTTPYYGTVLYEQCKKEGTILTEDLSNYCSNEAVFLPKTYKSREQLKQLYKRAYRKFYLRPRYIFKHLAKIRHPRDIKKYLTGLKLLTGFTLLDNQK